MPSAPPRAAPPAAAADTGGWTEHKNTEGKVYYYHKASNKTTWEKPDALKTAEERLMGSAATSWKEFTAASGRKYYYNSETKATTWEMPEEMKKAMAAAEKASGGGSATASAPVAVGSAAAPAPAAAGAPAAAEDNSEQKRQFCAMLAAAGVVWSMSWEEAMRLIINNPTYRVLNTLSERKAAFLEWRDARREEHEEEERKALRQKKVDFLSLLKGCAELTSRTRYDRVISLFEADPRWQALDDELEREELFEEYSLSLERKEAADRRGRRKEAMADFRALLESRELSVRSQWRKVQATLEHEPAFRAIDKIDRLAVYEEYMRDLVMRDERDRQAAKEATRQQDRRKRDAFRSLLLTLHREGKITPRTRWKDVVDQLRQTVEYRAAVDQAGSTPAELFEDMLESVSDDYSAHRRAIRSYLTAGEGFEITPSTTEEALAATVRSAAAAEGQAAPPAWAISTYLADHLERFARERRSASRSDDSDGDGRGGKERRKRERHDRDGKDRRHERKSKRSRRHKDGSDKVAEEEAVGVEVSEGEVKVDVGAAAAKEEGEA